MNPEILNNEPREVADSDDDIFGVRNLSLQKSLSTKAKRRKSRESARSVSCDRHVKKIKQEPHIENIRSASNTGAIRKIVSCRQKVKKNFDSKTNYSTEDGSNQTSQVNGSDCTDVHFEKNSVDKTIGKYPKNKQTLQVNGTGGLEVHSEENSLGKTIGKHPKNKQTLQVNGTGSSEVHSEENSVDKTIGKRPKNKQTRQVNRSACSEVYSEENSVDIKEKRISVIATKNKNEISNSTIFKPVGKITPNIKKVTVKKKSKQTTEDDAKGDSVDIKPNKSITRKKEKENGNKEVGKLTPKTKMVIENNKIQESLLLDSKTKRPNKRKYDAQQKEEATLIKKKCSKIKTVSDIDVQSGFQAPLPFEEMVFHELQPGVLSTCAISAKDTTCGYILIQSNQCLTSEMTSSITFSLVIGSLTVIQNGKTYIVNEGSFIYMSDVPYSFKNDTADRVLLSYFKSN